MSNMKTIALYAGVAVILAADVVAFCGFLGAQWAIRWFN